MRSKRRKMIRRAGVSVFAAATAYGTLGLVAAGTASAYGPTSPPSNGPYSSVPSNGDGGNTGAAVGTSSTGSSLAFTGTDALITTVAGAGAIGAGGALVLVSRRRRVQSA